MASSANISCLLWRLRHHARLKCSRSFFRVWYSPVNWGHNIRSQLFLFEIFKLIRITLLGLVRYFSNTCVPALVDHSSHLLVLVMTSHLCSHSPLPLVFMALDKLFSLSLCISDGPFGIYFILQTRMHRLGLVRSPPKMNILRFLVPPSFTTIYYQSYIS